MRLTSPAAALLLLGTLGACGGGGSGTAPPLSTISSAPPPPAPVAPPPPPASFDTAEYRRSGAAVASGAINAWMAGADGRGVTVAIIDSGIAADNAEFAGRIASSSRDTSGASRGISDQDGHGTAVAGVIGAARNDQGIVGLAPAVTLAVMKADTAGSCAGDGCRFSDTAIAAGIDAAVASGARAINISLGGGSGGQSLRNAVARATAAGAVIVVSGGNDGLANPDPLALAILSAGNRANILIAAGHGENGAIASFANQAGTAMQNVVTALATRVRSFDHTGTVQLYSGTSFATPQVTAAAALLAQAFPQLSGAQIVELILSSARDAGAPGTDPVYGRGILDIGRAFAPNGATSLAGSALGLSLSSNGNLGAAMGSGLSFGTALGQVPLEDSYGRRYTVALGHSLRASGHGRLRSALMGQTLHSAETRSAGNGWTTRFSVRAVAAPGALAQQQQALNSHLGLAHRGTDAHAGSVRPIRETRLTLESGDWRFGAATGPSAAAMLPGNAQPGLVAPDGLEPDHDPARTGRLLLMAEIPAGPLRLAAAVSQGREPLARTPGLPQASRQQRAMLAADLPLGTLTLSGRLTHVVERGSFLGTRLAPGFGLEGARSLYVGAAATAEPIAGLTLRIAGTQGQHQPYLGPGLLAAAQGVRSHGWSFAVEARTPVGPLTLRHAQPLAITQGHYRLALDGNPLAPAGASERERATELSWSPLLDGFGQVNLTAFHRHQPGHRSGPADVGTALTFSRSF